MHHLKWLRCAAGMLALAAACASDARVPESLDALSERYVRAALRLAQHQPELVEAWRGPADWRPGPRQPVAGTAADVAALDEALAQVDDSSLTADAAVRLAYLRGQVKALDLAARRLLGESTPFAEEVGLAFGLGDDALALRQAQGPAGDEAHRALAAVLPGTGSIVERHRAFRQQFVVPADRREAVLRAALDACRTATLAHMALPDDEAIDLELDVDSPWDGLARYEGHHRSTIAVSRRGSLDVTRALTLACHEAYPGHHAQYVLIDSALVSGKGWTEMALAPRFGLHVLLTEGAAEAGVDLAMPHDVRLRLYQETIFPLAGLPVAKAAELVEVEERVRALDAAIPPIIGAYLDSKMSRADAEQALGDAGVLDPESFIGFAERRRSLAVVYPLGRRRVARYLAAGADPWERLAALFTGRGHL